MIIKKTLATSLLLFSSISFAGWNIVDHPFETVIIENGDKLEFWGDRVSFWTRFTLNQNGDIKRSKHRHYVDCKTMTAVEVYRESDFTDEHPTSNVKEFNGDEMLYYAISSRCSELNGDGWGMCYPEDEDLDRTPQEEMLDILTKEVEL